MAQDIFNTFFAHQIAFTFLIIAIGYAIGRLSFKGVTLGSSGVLFVALLFGHLGFTIPKVIQDLGIILFVYMIGLQTGPRFFSTFRKRGLVFMQLAVVIILSGISISVAVSYFFKISPELTAGIFAGALTSTPGLAAAIEASGSSLASIGYGIAYPFGIVGMIVFVQLLPRLLKVDLEAVNGEIRKNDAVSDNNIVKKVLIVENPTINGKSIQELNLHKYSNANITRIQHDDHVLPVKTDSLLHIGDHIAVVGLKTDIDTLKLLIGEEAEESQIYASDEVVHRDVFISDSRFSGKRISNLQIPLRYSVVVTRIRRDGMEFTPKEKFVLEIGDSVRVAGMKEDCERFVKDAGHHEKHVHETNILTFSSGIVLGSILGFTPFDLPGGITLRLGLAGGPLFVALLFSHFGRVGRFNIRVPYGAKYILRELGLVFFLAGAGTAAGENLWSILQLHGFILFFAGSLVTILPLTAAYFFCARVLKLNLLSTLGAISGGMTSTPSLGVIMNEVDSEVPALSYTAIYPIALIMMTVGSQLLVMLL